MLKTTTLSLKSAYLITAAAFVLAALASMPSQAVMSSGEAVTLCKTEIQNRYSEEVHIKIRRICSGHTVNVKMKVRGVTDSAFIVDRAVSGEKSIALTSTGDTPAAVATRSDTLKDAS